ncbi:MAG: T9SS type A sorting domain-containing protein [Bacteroidales bacterium]
MNFKGLYFLTINLLLLTAFTGLNAQTNYYTAQNGDWKNASTWAGNNKPGSWVSQNDTVFIDHNVELKKNLGLAGVVTVSSGNSISGNADISIQSTATIISDGVIDIKKMNIWGGKLASTGDVEVSHGIQSTSSSYMQIDGTLISGSHINLDSSSTLIIGSNLNANGKLTFNDNSDVTIHGNLFVSGETSLNTSSSLKISDSSSFNSHVTVGLNSVLQTDGAGSLDGNLTINGGDLTIGDSFIIHNHTTINGGSDISITNNGSLTTQGNVTLNSAGAIINNNGNITTNGNFSNGGTVNNNGSWEANDSFINDWGGTFTNNNDLIANDGIQNKNLFTNNGSIDSQNDFINDWSTEFANNGTFFITGNASNNGLINGAGNLLIDGFLDNSNGNINGCGYICHPDGQTDPTTGNGNSKGSKGNIDSSVQICGATDDDPLPVEFVKFEAIPLNNDAVKLNWATASEINNEHFTVQRSVKDDDFQDINIISGAGNANELITYTYTDKNAPKGQTLYYRIKQTDYDGTISYSRIIDVNNNQKPISRVFPNPAPQGETVTIQSSANNITIHVYNLKGKKVFSKNLKQNEIKIPTTNLNPGIYFVRTENMHRSGSSTQKLIIR